ncbi:DUF6147 family protein [Bariatricus sp. HCP28S3_A7]|uniref:DUF6147 family protein n=1 Tax=Bariatricus sp. HCP28S3_A7 TaxID=3438894 RepID=UPI003F89A543
MKKLKAILLMVTMITGLVFMGDRNVMAADTSECVDGSYLIDENYSEGEAVLKTRGMYLKSGTSSIAEAGTGKITAGGRTVGQVVVSKIVVAVRVERLVNGSWETYTSWSSTKYNAALVSTSKTLSVPIGYYYRVYSTHVASSDTSDSYTNGIHI